MIFVRSMMAIAIAVMMTTILLINTPSDAETVKVIHSKLPLAPNNHKVIRTAWYWENEIPQSHRKLLS
jgi:hypothetical protein